MLNLWSRFVIRSIHILFYEIFFIDRIIQRFEINPFEGSIDSNDCNDLLIVIDSSSSNDRKLFNKVTNDL